MLQRSWLKSAAFRADFQSIRHFLQQIHCYVTPLFRCVKAALKDRRLKSSQVGKMAPMLKKGDGHTRPSASWRGPTPRRLWRVSSARPSITRG